MYGQKIIDKAEYGNLAATRPINKVMAENFISCLELKPSSLRLYRDTLRYFFDWLDKHKINFPRREDILAYKDALQSEGKRSTVIQTRFSVLKQFFKWLQSSGRYVNIADNIKTPISREDSAAPKRKAVSLPQLENILNKIDRKNFQGLRNYAIITLMAVCGLNAPEIISAKLADLDLDLETPELYIPSRNAALPLKTSVSDALNAYINAGRAENFFSNNNSPLFISLSNYNKGGELTSRTVRRVVSDALSSAGCDAAKFGSKSLNRTAGLMALFNILQGSEAQDEIINLKLLSKLKIY